MTVLYLCLANVFCVAQTASAIYKKSGFEGTEKVELNFDYQLNFTDSLSVFRPLGNIPTSRTGTTAEGRLAASDFGKNPVFYNLSSRRLQFKFPLGESLAAIYKEGPPILWEITAEQKVVNNVRCFKAIGRKDIFKVLGTGSADKGSDQWPVEAWFAPQISFNTGPAIYVGLPGLVVYVHDQTRNVTYELVDINLKDTIAYDIPKMDPDAIPSDEFENKFMALVKRYRKKAQQLKNKQ